MKKLIKVFVQEAKADVEFGGKLSVQLLGYDNRVPGRSRLGIGASRSYPEEQTGQKCHDTKKSPEIQIAIHPLLEEGVIDDTETRIQAETDAQRTIQVVHRQPVVAGKEQQRHNHDRDSKSHSAVHVQGQFIPVLS